MKARLIWLIACSYIAVATWSAPAAAVDYFLKLEGVDGEATAKGHEKEIELLSYSWGVSNPGASGARAQELSVVKTMDKSTPKLMLSCATGQPIPLGVITLERPNPAGTGEPVPYLVITMSDILVSSYQTSSSSSDPMPVESLSLNFTKVEFKYTPYDRTTGEAQEPVVFQWEVPRGVL